MTDIKKRIFSIIYLLVFLGVTTWFFYGPRKYLEYVAMNLNKFYTSRDLELKSNKIKIGNNKFSIKNKTDKEIQYVLVMNNDYSKLRSNKCKQMSNNYLSYHITDGGLYDIERVLATDGIIYRGTLKSKEEKNFSLYITNDNEDTSEKYCFYPVLHASIEDRETIE